MSDKTLVQHMAEVMKEVGYVQKDATMGSGGSFSYTYASAQAVFDKVRSSLSERGIAVCGDVELVASEIVGPKNKHLVVAKHTITFTDGTDSLSVSALGEGIDAGDKASMKANTAAVKYCLAKAFLISWGDDPEADPASDGQEEDPHKQAIADWQEKCGPACTSVDAAKKWWEDNKAQIKSDCGEAGAADGVYPMWATYYERLKAEVAE